ncbi:MAG: S46 family peptidase [Opitutae bacterium]|nr:S46 family peptidase [Opitutae bacterium]
MNMKAILRLFLAWLGLAACARADEGMWLYNNAPRAQIKARYGFEVTDAWLDHLRLASVRFNSGGSGSFVSADGLAITNHHVGADALQKMSSEKNNYLRDGFYARTAAEEIKCVDLELNVLQSIEDVTARVNAAVPATATGDEAAAARRKITAEIERESREKTGLRSDVVTLYQGGQYHLYRFKRYTDIRLVFAPEQQIAFYGGDPDNFEYPRYDLDVCLFRVYENDQPVRPAHYLKWSPVGAQDGELVFVSGHPGRTSRLLTVAELEYLRDNSLPYTLMLLKRREVLLTAWGARHEENARRVRDALFSVQNYRKVRDGELAALQDPAVMDAKRTAEKAFQQKLAGPGGSADALAAYTKIAAATQEIGRYALRYRLLEGDRRNIFSAPQGLTSESFGIARTLLRAAEERAKPNGERLKEYADAKRESFELELFSDKPIYTDYEIISLADALAFLAEQLGYNDATVVKMLAGKSPRARAAELINGTQVRSVEFRRKLYAGGSDAVKTARDPMIELARLIDAEARGLRKTLETQDEIKQQAQGAIARARFALEGTSNYPDATFTLRLSYGAVRGYDEDGKFIPALTNFAGLYERSASQHNRPPFDLPPRWSERKAALNLATPFNFVSTCDIIGGNSGSPTVNRAGEFVGIIFDGNLQSLVGSFAYEDVYNRALSVHSAAIIESLRKIYDAPALADELLNGKR